MITAPPPTITQEMEQELGGYPLSVPAVWTLMCTQHSLGDPQVPTCVGFCLFGLLSWGLGPEQGESEAWAGGRLDPLTPSLVLSCAVCRAPVCIQLGRPRCAGMRHRLGRDLESWCSRASLAGDPLSPHPGPPCCSQACWASVVVSRRLVHAPIVVSGRNTGD